MQAEKRYADGLKKVEVYKNRMEKAQNELLFITSYLTMLERESLELENIKIAALEAPANSFTFNPQEVEAGTLTNCRKTSQGFAVYYKGVCPKCGHTCHDTLTVANYKSESTIVPMYCDVCKQYSFVKI
jgi:hypothetical protein